MPLTKILAVYRRYECLIRVQETVRLQSDAVRRSSGGQSSGEVVKRRSEHVRSRGYLSLTFGKNICKLRTNIFFIFIIFTLRSIYKLLTRRKNKQNYSQTRFERTAYSSTYASFKNSKNYIVMMVWEAVRVLESKDIHGMASVVQVLLMKSYLGVIVATYCPDSLGRLHLGRPG